MVRGSTRVPPLVFVLGAAAGVTAACNAITGGQEIDFVKSVHGEVCPSYP